MKLPFTPEQRSRLFEIFRYGIGCGLALLVKYLLTLLFKAFDHSLDQSYFIAILIILFVSYTYHSRITFRYQSQNRKEHLHNLLAFSATLLLFNALDYLLVTTGNRYLEARIQHSHLSITLQNLILLAQILTSSALIFILRFFCYRFIFKRH